MAEQYDQRNLPATTHEQELTTHGAWHLTKSQWAVYYWLVAKSCWVSPQKHYFIYQRDWTYAQIAKECAISTKTVSRAIVVLMEKHIIEAVGDARAYSIYWPYDCYASLDKNLILSFISLSKSVDITLFIKLYTLLVYGFEHRLNHFTISALRTALNLHNSSENYMLIMSMIALWEHWHLLELTQVERVNRLGTRYIEYTITNIKKSADNLSAYMPNNIDELVEDWLAVSKQMVDIGVTEE